MSIKTKIISIVLVSIMAVALASPLAQAAIPKPNTLPGQTTAEQENVSAKEHVGTVVIPRIVNILIGAATLMCFALIIYGGIRYMLAYGDDEAINESKRVIIYSLVGLLIALFSYAIVAIITSVEFDKKVTLVPTAYAAYSEDDIKDIDSSIFVDGSKKDQFKQIENLPFVKIAKEDSETPGDIISYIRSGLYNNVIKLALGIASALIVIGFLVAGTMYVTAQGNEDQTNKAKSVLIYTLVAVAIIASAYAITLGVTTLKDLIWTE